MKTKLIDKLWEKKWREWVLHELPQNVEIRDRWNIIFEHCAGKNVLHLGCVGFNQADGTFGVFHRSIMKIARQVCGVDLDEERLSLMSREGIPNLINGDAQKLNEMDFPFPVEVIIAGEILEHLDNPGIFLKNINSFMQKNKSVLIITVPNAYSLRNYLYYFLGVEMSNPEHKFIFSYVTLSRFLAKYAFNVDKVYVIEERAASSSIFKRVGKYIYNSMIRKYPLMAEGLAFAVSCKEK